MTKKFIQFTQNYFLLNKKIFEKDFNEFTTRPSEVQVTLKLENQTAIRLFKSASYIRIIGFVRNKNFGVYEGYLKRA